MNTRTAISNGMASLVPVQGRGVRAWQRWTPYAAVAWSLIYAVMGIYWAVGGHGFPFTPQSTSTALGPLAGRLGSSVAWIVVMMAGIPAAAVGAAMLRSVQSRALRPLFIAFGALIAGVLLLLMTDINLLILLGYIPYTIRSFFQGTAFGHDYLELWTQWATIHQLLCLTGGFLWLAATASYSRRSAGACLYCGLRAGPEGWQSPDQAARWGRIAIYVSMVTPVFYALTRYAWALGIPLGISEAYLRWGQERGMWTSGLFLATFGLVGAALTLGLMQHWGEVFPRWMIGLAGRRVPILLAGIPASLVSVLLVVGGITMWSGIDQMVTASAASGAVGARLFWEIVVLVGPILLFPIWGAALALATLGYYYRRRGLCSVCGRGAYRETSRS